MRTLTALILGVTVVALCGCAGTQRRSYSVEQVKTVFAAQGIALHSSALRPRGRFVWLDNGDNGGAVTVSVYVGPKRKAGGFSYVGWGGDRVEKHSNVLVAYDRPFAARIRAALRRLG